MKKIDDSARLRDEITLRLADRIRYSALEPCILQKMIEEEQVKPTAWQTFKSKIKWKWYSFRESAAKFVTKALGIQWPEDSDY